MIDHSNEKMIDDKRRVITSIYCEEDETYRFRLSCGHVGHLSKEYVQRRYEGIPPKFARCIRCRANDEGDINNDKI